MTTLLFGTIIACVWIMCISDKPEKAHKEQVFEP